MAENLVENLDEALTEQERQSLLQIRRDKLTALVEAGKNPYEKTKFNVKHNSKQILDAVQKFENKRVTVAGRLISKRVMGKASFA
ncbi:MAG: lysine--tRNA ligase, partial [Clostridia bacterium]|nr:lysine--tRNA ligase [Clostridia bacterium]